MTISSNKFSLLGQRQQPRGCIIDNIDMCGYESHKQMVNKMMQLQQRFPNIAKVIPAQWP